MKYVVTSTGYVVFLSTAKFTIFEPFSDVGLLSTVDISRKFNVFPPLQSLPLSAGILCRLTGEPNLFLFAYFLTPAGGYPAGKFKFLFTH